LNYVDYEIKKVCCESFQFRHDGNSQMGLNFRIIRLSDEFIRRGYTGNNKYRYLVTEGYTFLSDNTKLIAIEFCPIVVKIKLNL